MVSNFAAGAVNLALIEPDSASFEEDLEFLIVQSKFRSLPKLAPTLSQRSKLEKLTSRSISTCDGRDRVSVSDTRTATATGVRPLLGLEEWGYHFQSF